MNTVAFQWACVAWIGVMTLLTLVEHMRAATGMTLLGVFAEGLCFAALVYLAVGA